MGKIARVVEQDVAFAPIPYDPPRQVGWRDARLGQAAKNSRLPQVVRAHVGVGEERALVTTTGQVDGDGHH